MTREKSTRKKKERKDEVKPDAIMELRQSSVELKHDTKGSVVVTAKAYANGIDEAMVQAVAAFEKLRSHFGLAEKKR